MELIDRTLGLSVDSLGVGQMALRAVIVFVLALVYVRVGDKRFLGKSTAFDVVLAIMFGSLMSRAMTQSRQFLPIIVSGAVLIALHWLAAWLSFRSDRVGALVKGSERRLVSRGEVQWDEMAASHVTPRDLLGGLRAQGVEEPDQVDEAILERSGEISVVRRSQPARVVEVEVAEGVQTVRIELRS